MGWLIAGIISGVITVVAFAVSITAPVNMANAFAAVALLIATVVLLLRYRKAKGKTSTATVPKPAPKNTPRKRAADLCASVSLWAKHMAGLPMPESAPCYLYLCTDRVVIDRDNTSYDLPISKITDAVVKTETEIRSNYVSSIGGAVAGGMLFGPLGAIVGGRTKKKEDRTIHSYLIFSYDKSGDMDYISFDITHDPQKAKKIVTACKAHQPPRTVHL